MSGTLTNPAETVASASLDELTELIRQVLRKEIPTILEEWRAGAGPTTVEPGSPVHEDLVEILRLGETDQLGLLSYEQVFGD